MALNLSDVFNNKRNLIPFLLRLVRLAIVWTWDHASHASLSRPGLGRAGALCQRGLIGQMPADLFSTTGGHHSSVGKGSGEWAY